MDSPTRHTAGHLFAAVGGFCRAFQVAGATSLWANENDPFAAQTFRLNFPEVRLIHKSIEAVTVALDSLCAVDVLTAGFPCQPFSIAGEKLGFQDERGLLFLHIIRLLREFGKDKPKVLLLENVKNLKSHDRGRTFKRIQSEIQKAGYWFTVENARILNTAEYSDIPQNRERLFMVAMSTAHFPVNSFLFPEPISPPANRPVWDYLDYHEKAEDCFYFTPASQYYGMFQQEIEKGGADAVYQLRRSYVRQNKSGQCFTLMANMGEGGHNQPVIRDRWGIRKLTPRECARLQGYEDIWFKMPAGLSKNQLYKQMGNSVTVPVVTRLASEILHHLEADRASADAA